MDTRGFVSRMGKAFACCGLMVVLASCNQPDLLAKLKADKPQDPRASQMCHSDRLAKDYVIAAGGSTVAEIRPYAGKSTEILDGRPDDEFVALCLLDVPDAELVAGGLPAGSGPLTEAVLPDRSSMWLSSPQ
jgi:hypothetical protein